MCESIGKNSKPAATLPWRSSRCRTRAWAFPQDKLGRDLQTVRSSWRAPRKRKAGHGPGTCHLVKRLVEIMGGTVTVASGCLKQGFSISSPIYLMCPFRHDFRFPAKSFLQRGCKFQRVAFCHFCWWWMTMKSTAS